MSDGGKIEELKAPAGVQINGEKIWLSPVPARILARLLAAKGGVLSRESFGNTALDSHVCKIREELIPYGYDIQPVKGIGYRLVGHGIHPCRCGDNAHLYFNNSKGSRQYNAGKFYVFCQNCDSEGPARKVKEEAVAGWNAMMKGEKK